MGTYADAVHLPARRYRDITDRILFQNFGKDLTDNERAKLKARTLASWTTDICRTNRSERKHKTALDRPIFAQRAVEQARSSVKDACDQLGGIPTYDDCFETARTWHEITSELLRRIRFSFNTEFDDDLSNIENVDSGEPTSKALKALALELLSCDALDDFDEISLFDLYAKCSSSQEQSVQYKHIETVDLCDSPEDLMFQLCRYVTGLEEKEEPEQEALADNVALMIRRNAVGNLAILRKADIEEANFIPWVRQLDWRIRSVINPMRRRERFSEKIALETAISRLQERRAADLGTAFHELVQHLGALGEALGATSRSIQKVENGKPDVVELVRNMSGARDDFAIVAAVVEAQMNFAKNMPEDFSRLAVDRQLLEKFFTRFDEWSDAAEELWGGVLCECKPYKITAQEGSDVPKIKLPFVSVYSLVRELLRNFMRYGDIERPAWFTNHIFLDESRIVIEVKNGISDELTRDRQKFKRDRINRFRAIATSDEEVDKFLGHNWIEHNIGIGIRGLFTNYLIRNFSSDAESEAREFNRNADAQTMNFRYAGSNQFGSVEAETVKRDESEGATYNLSISITLPKPEFES